MDEPMIADAAGRRSYLFVPGDRPERFAKAAASGADAVIIDLEDAVPIHAKDTARRHVLAHLSDAQRRGVSTFVRINPPRTMAGLTDLAAIMTEAGRGVMPAGIVVPKSSAADIALVGDLLSDAGARMELGALVETCAGIEDAFAIAKSSPSLTFLMFGGADLAAELGVEIAWDPLLASRARLVQAAAAAGRAVVDMPWIALDDEPGEADEMKRSFALGFTARAAIHPRQVPRIHAMLAPDAAALDSARRVLAAYEAARGGACLLDGRLIERPTIERSRRLLARARLQEATA